MSVNNLSIMTFNYQATPAGPLPHMSVNKLSIMTFHHFNHQATLAPYVSK